MRHGGAQAGTCPGRRGAASERMRVRDCHLAAHGLTVNQSLQRLTASIVVPLRVVRLSVAPLSVAMMSAAPLSLVHSREHNAERCRRV